MWTTAVWIGLALLGLILYLLPAILQRVSLEGFAVLTSNPNLQAIDPTLISDLGLGDSVLELANQLQNADSASSSVKASNMVMSPPVTGDSPNVLSPGLTHTTQVNVNPAELKDVADLLTTIKDIAQSPDTVPDHSSTKSSTPAPAVMPALPSRAETQGTVYNKNKRENSNVDGVREYAREDSTDSSKYAPIDVPSPSQLLQCPTCPKCAPVKKCPPQKLCPDLTDYIRKDSIPCWNCKLK